MMILPVWAAGPSNPPQTEIQPFPLPCRAGCCGGFSRASYQEPRSKHRWLRECHA